jgi:hypothetical protein
VKNNIKFTLLGVLVSLFVAACFSVKPVYYEADKKMAESEIENFHKLFNEKNFERIYETVDKETAKKKSKDDFFQILSEVDTQLGKVKQTKILKANVTQESTVRQVEVECETTFEKGVQKEKFIFLIRSSQIGLASYAIF